MSVVLSLPATRAWIVLVGAAFVSLLLSNSGLAVRVSTTGVVLVAALKLRLIVTYFMALEWSHRPWRILFEVWIWAVTLTILGGYWLVANS